MNTQFVELPLPPSANALWKYARYRKGAASVHMDQVYRDWLEFAVLKLKTGLEKVKAYPVKIRVLVRRGPEWNEKRDLDNCLKPIVDSLRKSERIVDDNGQYVSGVRIDFGPDAPRACVLVYLEADMDGGSSQ